MYRCMVCGNITNLNFSLCTLCLNKQLELNRKKYNWPFESNQSIRFNNLKKC